MKSFADKLRYIRISMGLSQTALAQKCGLTQREVSRIELGKKDRIPHTLLSFLMSCGYNLDAVLKADQDYEMKFAVTSGNTAPDNLPDSETEVIIRRIDGLYEQIKFLNEKLQGQEMLIKQILDLSSVDDSRKLMKRTNSE